MSGVRDDGCDWVCDSCGAYMNTQRRFSVARGTWKCTKCGALNDVSQNNVLDLLGMAAKGISKFVTRPLQESGKSDD